jgi:hypothetical protein
MTWFVYLYSKVIMATILKRRRNEASILTSFSIWKRNEPAYSRTLFILQIGQIEAKSVYSTNLKERSGANSVYSTNWTDRSEAKSVYSTNSKGRSEVKSIYSTNSKNQSEANSTYSSNRQDRSEKNELEEVKANQRC